ncbi:MAG: dimethyl sulfone monooxygenase SfnG [Bacillaceae bacterium]|jgi:FMNH2-dependent dimethyl sulfone monooxygenase|uniref:Dimethyl sulfone monooxygenase SfnG n=2 Tax=Aeribacillus TaxID=1055323 RepID=A0A165Z594_9BACI|nr:MULTISPECIES: dimethyl sulfone monooxygenase SfnG [Aeribacillus]REJ13934.1 MAG: dimethyl sulfone monooxygenase SfnG [Bacillaceae bacterium]KZN97858.1 dimethyl sulfone monooxygenase SfnG [Aeribacillus pallidus]MDR9797433.1 dimethyl sulfone monooxygenase SfnG [Aeribacillus pallidus]MED0702396.1 dimethyl sulfone monooxygenase SfnG [Aeribacillus composti]MED0714665.1 dimethyl sulfone monooxygenase SfnG [Aeribacillus composti]
MGLQFAYWAPNVSGGLVISNLPQKTGWSFEDNKRYAQIAEENGFDYVLLQTRFFASYGAEKQLEAAALASALAASTKKLNIITAVLPGLWHPGVIAKIISTIDHISNGRASINIVSGWFKNEFIGYGEPWLDHDERYRRSEEFIQVLRDLWTKETTTFKGDFYRINEAPLKPKPINIPKIFQGGNSKAAREMAGRVSDVYFMNGNSLENLKKQIDHVKSLAESNGRNIQFGVNGFVIVRDTEEEAKQVLKDIVLHADKEAVEGFESQVKFAGKASPEGEGMWAESTFEDLVQYNDGFKTGLIGTAEQVADRIIELKKIGVDIVLTGFLHYDEDLKAFGEKVIPLVREKEAKLEGILAN